MDEIKHHSAIHFCTMDAFCLAVDWKIPLQPDDSDLAFWWLNIVIFIALCGCMPGIAVMLGSELK